MKLLLFWLLRPWRRLRQTDRLEDLRAENQKLRVTCDLLVDREKNLKANLALALSEAGRIHAELKRKGG